MALPNRTVLTDLTRPPWRRASPLGHLTIGAVPCPDKLRAEMTVASNTVIGTLPGGTEVVAASLEAGRELLTTVDDYLSQQSPFDRQARVNLRR